MITPFSSKKDTDKEDPDIIDCFSCTFFFITHDRHYPYGCRAAGFKSRIMPSRDMYINSAIPCQLFQEKKKSP